MILILAAQSTAWFLLCLAAVPSPTESDSIRGFAACSITLWVSSLLHNLPDTVGESVTNSPTRVLHSQREMTNQGFELL
jgi:hypothetical protein